MVNQDNQVFTVSLILTVSLFASHLFLWKDAFPAFLEDTAISGIGIFAVDFLRHRFDCVHGSLTGGLAWDWRLHKLNQFRFTCFIIVNNLIVFQYNSNKDIFEWAFCDGDVGDTQIFFCLVHVQKHIWYFVTCWHLENQRLTDSSGNWCTFELSQNILFDSLQSFFDCLLFNLLLVPYKLVYWSSEVILIVFVLV